MTEEPFAHDHHKRSFCLYNQTRIGSMHYTKTTKGRPVNMHQRFVKLLSAILFVSAMCHSYASDAPSPVLLIGDSMMRLPGMAVERELARTIPSVQAHTFAGIGTGLARLDTFDWMAKIKELCDTHTPRVAVVALGANDRQPMQIPGHHSVVRPDTPEWDTEYAARIARAMDLFLSQGCDKIIWLLLPPMRDPAVHEHAMKLNDMATAAAETRPQVKLFDVGSLFADRRTGGFTERMVDPVSAAAGTVRERDGIHLSPQGARMLASALVAKYWKAE